MKMVARKPQEILAHEIKRIKNEKAADMMIGKWVKCDQCKEIIYKSNRIFQR